MYFNLKRMEWLKVLILEGGKLISISIWRGQMFEQIKTRIIFLRSLQGSYHTDLGGGGHFNFGGKGL